MTELMDARGLSCPLPVVMTKKKLNEMAAGSLDVMVDDQTSAENVLNFARGSGCEAFIEEKNGIYVVHVSKAGCATIPQQIGHETVVFVRSNTIGRGDDELGTILMRSFIPTLLEIDSKPKKMIFMNSGVKLTTEGSPVVEALRKIEEKGVELLICGTCLDYFGLKDQIRVGRVSNMFEIVQTLSKADKILSL
jgi:selenium metabolism protein YedF